MVGRGLSEYAERHSARVRAITAGGQGERSGTGHGAILQGLPVLPGAGWCRTKPSSATPSVPGHALLCGSGVLTGGEAETRETGSVI